jgi:hypothetical protein
VHGRRTACSRRWIITIDYLKTKGVAITWGPRVREGQYARAEIRDPNGYNIELRHWFDRR